MEVGRARFPDNQPGFGRMNHFSYDPDKRAIVRKSRAEFAPGPGETKGLIHDDRLVIYQQPGDLHSQAIYFDDEGHIIHYTRSFPAKQPGVVFKSETHQTSPRARLLHVVTEDNTLVTEFSVEAPGGDLLSHVKGTVIRDS